MLSDIIDNQTNLRPIKPTKNNLLYILVSLLVCLSPIVSQYLLPYFNFVGFDVVFLLFACALVFLCNKRIVFFLPFFLFPFLLLFLIGFDNYFLYKDISGTISNSLPLFVYFLSISVILGSNSLRKDIFFDVYFKISAICVFLAVLQTISHYIFNKELSFNLNFLKSIRDDAEISLERGKAMSVFTEPAHFAFYISPCLFLNFKNKKWISAFFSLVGLVCSLSTTAYIAVALVCIIYFIGKSKNNKLFIIPLFLIFAVLFYLMFFGYTLEDTFLYIVTRKLQISNLLENERVFLTIKFLPNFSFNEWLCGIGYNKMGVWANNHAYPLNNYAPTPIKAIYSFGVLGLLIYLAAMYILYKNINLYGKQLFFFINLLLLGGSHFISITLMFVLTLLLLNCKIVQIGDSSFAYFSKKQEFSELNI